MKERRITRTRRRIIIIIIRNGAKTISLQTLFGRLNKVLVLKITSVG
jgi:Fe2+ or Zn2+ uptake regulation protein